MTYATHPNSIGREHGGPPDPPEEHEPEPTVEELERSIRDMCDRLYEWETEEFGLAGRAYDTPLSHRQIAIRLQRIRLGLPREASAEKRGSW